MSKWVNVSIKRPMPGPVGGGILYKVCDEPGGTVYNATFTVMVQGYGTGFWTITDFPAGFVPAKTPAYWLDTSLR